MAQEFDDEVLGAPAYPGLLYLTSTHNGRLSKVPHRLNNGEDTMECPEMKTVFYKHTSTPSFSLLCSKVLITTRMAREATAKTGGAKFLKRNRALEEDEKFMARETAGFDHLHILAVYETHFFPLIVDAFNAAFPLKVGLQEGIVP